MVRLTSIGHLPIRDKVRPVRDKSDGRQSIFSSHCLSRTWQGIVRYTSSGLVRVVHQTGRHLRSGVRGLSFPRRRWSEDTFMLSQSNVLGEASIVRCE